MPVGANEESVRWAPDRTWKWYLRHKLPVQFDSLRVKAANLIWHGSGSSRDEQGGFPERPKGTDCKSVAVSFAGSNPAPATEREQSRSRLAEGVSGFTKLVTFLIWKVGNELIS